MKEETTEIVSVPSDDKGTVEIVPLGTDERIKLSIAIVKKLIAQPTRTGKLPDDNQCMKFIMLCKSRHLNPFEGDAYLLGYDTQTGPQFSLITAHQVFLKRAEASKGFEGMQSGVIVKTTEGNVVENEGDIVMKGETLIGGWAKVYRKDRTYPFYKRLDFNKFTTGRSRWEKDGPGMIVKCAEADALRTAFPTHLGGLYVDEEIPPIDLIDEPRLQIKPAQIKRIRGGSKILQDSEPTQNGEENGGSGEGEAVESNSGDTAENDTTTLTPHKEPATTKPPKSKKKLEGMVTDSEPEVAGPNETKMLMRLEALKSSTEQLAVVARNFEVVDEGQGFDDITEDKFDVMLREANWTLVEEALKA